MVILNRAGFISRQRPLGVSLEKHLDLNLHLPSNMSDVSPPSFYSRIRPVPYRFSQMISPWWSQPIYLLQPSPPSDKPTQSYVNPASPPLTSSPLIALNIPHPLPEDSGFPLSRYLAVQLPSHHSLALFSIITWF